MVNLKDPPRRHNSRSGVSLQHLRERKTAVLPALGAFRSRQQASLTRGYWRGKGRELMAARPSWQGHLRLSLVTCPVALYPATSEAETVRFNLINPKTDNRIRMQTVDAGTGEPVSRGDLVKGYQIGKGEYVILDRDDFESVKLESAHTLDIEKFVPRKSIIRVYWDVPYHLLPGGKTGIEALPWSARRCGTQQNVLTRCRRESARYRHGSPGRSGNHPIDDGVATVARHRGRRREPPLAGPLLDAPPVSCSDGERSSVRAGL